MDDREFFCQRHRAEFPTFMKVLEAMPVDQFAYRPHERSPSALDLVWTLANEMSACTTMIDRAEVRWDPPPAPMPREAVKGFHANYEVLDERVNRVGAEEWRRASKLYVGGKLHKSMAPCLPWGEYTYSAGPSGDDPGNQTQPGSQQA